MRTNDFLKGAAIGLAAGAIAALMLAPKSGRETREDLKKFSSDVGEKLGKTIGRLKGRAKDKYEDVIENFMADYDKMDLSDLQKEEIKQELRDTFERIKEIAEEEEE